MAGFINTKLYVGDRHGQHTVGSLKAQSRVKAISARGEHALHGIYAACSMGTSLMIEVARDNPAGKLFRCWASRGQI